jgi:hypothetical protein
MLKPISCSNAHFQSVTSISDLIGCDIFLCFTPPTFPHVFCSAPALPRGMSFHEASLRRQILSGSAPPPLGRGLVSNPRVSPRKRTAAAFSQPALGAQPTDVEVGGSGPVPALGALPTPVQAGGSVAIPAYRAQPSNVCFNLHSPQRTTIELV